MMQWDLDDGIVLLAILVALPVGYYLFSRSSKLRLPPGPWSPPIVGSLVLLTKNKSKTKLLKRLWQEYGDIYTLYLGSRRLVVLNNYRLLKEAFITNEEYTSCRPANMRAADMLTQVKGVAMVSGERQQMIRKWCLNAISSTADGKPPLTELVDEETGYLCRQITWKDGEPFDARPLVLQSVVNCVNLLLFGERSYEDDERFQSFLQLINLMETDVYLFRENYLPLIKYLKTDQKMQKRRLAETGIRKELSERVEELEKDYNPINIRGLVDLYFKQKDEAAKQDRISPEEISSVMQDLYRSATQTTVKVVCSGLALLSENSEVQDKCRQEINKIVGTTRHPSASHRTRLPYSDATVKEIFRLTDCTSFDQIHMTSQKFGLAGYEIPDGTFLLANLYRIHTDEATWDAPEEFRPERWIDPMGRVENHEEFVPYGIGARSCLGASMADTAVFTFLTAIVHKFALNSSDTRSPPSQQTEDFLHQTCSITAKPLTEAHDN